jgi:uncharacterized protein YodC (DUF2158 family)
MAANKFKVGDQVELISGGPVMTISMIGPEAVKTQWFSGKKLDYGFFPPETLNPHVPKTLDEKKQ